MRPISVTSVVVTAAVVAMALLGTCGATMARSSPVLRLRAAACNSAGNCTASLNELLSDASCHDGSGCAITLDAATYQMEVADRSQAVKLYGLRNVAITGAGSDSTLLVFERRSLFFVVDGCSNVTFEGFSVDMVRVPFTAGILVDYDMTPDAALSFTIRVDDNETYPIDPATVAANPTMAEAQAVIGYEPSTERYLVPDVYMTAAPCATTFNAAASTMRVQCASQRAPAPSQFSLGKQLVVRHQVYSYNAFSASGTPSQGLAWHDVTLFSAAGMGVYADFPTGVTARGLRTLRRRTPSKADPSVTLVRAMSINADGFHVCNALGGELLVEHAVFEGQGDDGINFNTRFARVENVTQSSNSASTTLTLSTKGANPANYFMVGAVPTFYDGRTMVEMPSPPSAQVTVIGIDAASSSITVSPPIADSASFPLLYALVVNRNAVAGSVVIRHSTFRKNRARGALMKQPRALIDNCTFEGMTSPAVLVQVDGCFWMEGLPVADWAIQRSTIRNADRWGSYMFVQVAAQVPVFDPHTGAPTTRCINAATPGVLRNISITETHFAMDAHDPEPPAQAVVDAAYAIGVDKLLLRDNRGLVSTQPSGRSVAFAAPHCTHVAFDGNACSSDGGVAWHNCSLVR
jgi:hypothetical protein